MSPKVLYIMSSYNIYGGTPKKTLDLMNYFGENAVLYVYHNSYPEFKSKFESTGGKIYEGFWGRNLYCHLKQLKKIVELEQINIVQTQFSMGELLGFLLKLIKPNLKLIVTFESAIKPSKIKGIITNCGYRFFSDCFVYISKYVKTEKEKQFQMLKRKPSFIICNGTDKRPVEVNELQLKTPFLLTVSSLIELKNIQIVIEALSVLKKRNSLNNLYYYVAGEGKYREKLEDVISKNNLVENVFLIGNQTNIGYLLKECEIFLHPSYDEGFGIAVAEAMFAEKPIIVSNTGALPELIENKKHGLVVDAYNPEEWADAILMLIEDKEYAQTLANNSKMKAEKEYSVNNYCLEYSNLYLKMLN